jgi:CheY-like chemotaxis protein
MAIAGDDFDAPLNRISYAQTPAPGTFASAADGFDRYQIGVSSSIPFDLIDQTTSGSPSDTFGIFVQGVKTDGWFGIADTDNPDNVGGASTATWQFDVAGASGLEVSIDMGAIGDFEAGADAFNWTYSIDGGPFQLLFSSTVDEAAQRTYTFANGNMATHQDPMSMTPVGGSATELSNALQTLTAPLSGSGATLSLRLDANTNGDDAAFAFDKPKPRPRPGPRRPGKPLVLVVEDNPDNMLTARAVLAEHYEVLEAGDGAAALALALSRPPDLVLMDISLPVMDGIQALQAMRAGESLRHVPVIALTASAMKGNREEILAHGFDGYIAKPIDTPSFLASIQRALDDA